MNTTKDKVSKLDLRPQAGDWVQIVNSSRNWAPEMGDFVGKLYKIKSIDPDGHTNFYKAPPSLLKWSWRFEDGHYILDPNTAKRTLKIKLNFGV